MFFGPCVCVFVLFSLLCGNLLIQGEATETKQMFNLAGAQEPAPGRAEIRTALKLAGKNRLVARPD